MLKTIRQELQKYRTPIKAMWYGLDALSYTGIAATTVASIVAASAMFFPIGIFMAPFIGTAGAVTGGAYYGISHGLRRLLLGSKTSSS